ncbi:MAG: RNA polymerase sigma factor [Actinomycetota bacterium]
MATDGRRSRRRPKVPGASAPADPRPNFPDQTVVFPSGTQTGGEPSTSQALAARRPPATLDERWLSPIVELARLGDLEAFEAIVRAMQGPVRSFTRRLLRDPHLGDDAAQETFLRMWKGVRRHEPRGRFIAWTFTVARNTCIEFMRREARTPIPVEQNEVSTDDSETRELRRVIDDAIAALGEPFRSTFVLRETGLSYDEIAEILGCPVGTIRSRLHVARRRLVELLRPVLGAED